MVDRYLEPESDLQRARSTRRLSDAEQADWNAAEDEDEDEYLGSAPVMIVDDSPAVRRVVELSLARLDIPTVSFKDGLTALRALYSQRVAPPRVLLLDIGMPRMNGYEVAKRLRTNQAYAQTRILMLSGHDGIINRALARMSGASGFIAKPFRSAELTERVCAVLQEQDAPAAGADQW